MAAVAPCAYHGCACGQWNHLQAFQSGRHAPQGPPVNLRLRQLLLEWRPFEEKAWDVHQLVQHMSADQVGPCVKAILEQPVPLRWMQMLSLQMLGELLHLHPAIVTSEFGKRNMSWLFPEQGDVDAGAMFLRTLLWNKQALGQNTRSEVGEFERILLKRTRQNDLCRVPACSARTWLAQIWKDVSSTRPKSDLLVSCMVRWLADQYERPEGKATCLEILQEEASRRTAADLEAWAVSLIFQEVCRQPLMQSADLQQLLLLGEERLHKKFCFPFLLIYSGYIVFLFFVVFSQFDAENCNPCKVFAASPTKCICCPILAWALKGWGLPDKSLDSLMQLGSSSSLVYCASLVLCRATPVRTPPICAGGFFPAGRLQKALPVSSHGFGSLGHQQLQYFKPGTHYPSYALSRRSSSSSRSMDAFGSLVGIFVPVLTTGSRTGKQVASTSKWKMLFCTTFGSTHPPAPPDCWSNGSHAEWTSTGRTIQLCHCPSASWQPILPRADGGPRMAHGTRPTVATAAASSLFSNKWFASASSTGLHEAFGHRNAVCNPCSRQVQSCCTQAT